MTGKSVPRQRKLEEDRGGYSLGRRRGSIKHLIKLLQWTTSNKTFFYRINLPTNSQPKLGTKCAHGLTRNYSVQISTNWRCHGRWHLISSHPDYVLVADGFDRMPSIVIALPEKLKLKLNFSPRGRLVCLHVEGHLFFLFLVTWSKLSFVSASFLTDDTWLF